jgi:hypothetical protein
MFTVQNATFLATFITYIIAYFVTVPGGGALRAWVAKKCGDDTPEDLGFLTLNPLAHFDTMGFIMLFFSYVSFRHFFGWGAFVPINPFNFTGKWGRLRLFITSVADVIGYLFSALIWTIILILLFDQKMAFLLYAAIIQHGNINHSYLLKEYPSKSPLLIIGAMILMATIVLSVILSMVYLIRNMFMLIPLMKLRNNEYEINNNFFVSFIVPALCIIFFMPFMLTITAQTLIYSALLCATYLTWIKILILAAFGF